MQSIPLANGNEFTYKARPLDRRDSITDLIIVFLDTIIAIMVISCQNDGHQHERTREI